MSAPASAMLDKQRIAANFNRAAASYDRHDLVQREVADRALERLDYVSLEPAAILDIGAGTGRAARALAKRYRRAQVTQFDLAHAMLTASRAAGRRLFSRQRFVCGDLEQLPFADAGYDFAFSSLALQWSENLAGAFAEVNRVLRPGGLFLFTTLGPDTLKELRAAFARISAAPHVNRFLDMHDVGDQLTGAGFADPVMETEYLTVEYDDGLELMRDLKGIGAVNAAAARSRGMLGRRRLRALLDAYEGERRAGKLPATYEVVYGHAWATDRLPSQQGEEHVFPLSRLRRR
ncbi:MAG: malonyl-ACP O-methyltransferase BioC [Gammaproteobacteria bacterium]